MHQGMYELAGFLVRGHQNPVGWLTLQGMYMHGDFVVHFFGQGHRKIELMKKAANKDFFWARR